MGDSIPGRRRNMCGGISGGQRQHVYLETLLGVQLGWCLHRAGREKSGERAAAGHEGLCT